MENAPRDPAEDLTAEEQTIVGEEDEQALISVRDAHTNTIEIEGKSHGLVASHQTLRPPAPIRSTSSLTATVFDVTSSSSTAYIALPATTAPTPTSSTSTSEANSFLHRNLGLLLIATAQLFFSTMNLSAKLLSQSHPPIHPLEIVFVRMLITWLGSLAYLYHQKITGIPFGPKGVRVLLIARGIFGFFVLFGIYYSLQYLALSDATVLQFLAPILTGYFGRMVLGEVFLRTELYAGILSFIGVVLIAHPQSLFGGQMTEAGATPLQRLSAVISSVIAAFAAAAAYITIRAIGSRAHPLISVSLFAFYSCIVSAVALLIRRSPFVFPRTFAAWVEWIVVGLSGFAGQFLLTSGLQIERAGRGVMPDFWSLSGSGLILGGAIWVAVAKARHIEGHVENSDGERNEYVAVELEDTNLGYRSGEFEVGDQEDDIDDRRSGKSDPHHRT